ECLGDCDPLAPFGSSAHIACIPVRRRAEERARGSPSVSQRPHRRAEHGAKGGGAELDAEDLAVAAESTPKAPRWHAEHLSAAGLHHHMNRGVRKRLHPTWSLEPPGDAPEVRDVGRKIRGRGKSPVRAALPVWRAGWEHSAGWTDGRRR